MNMTDLEAYRLEKKCPVALLEYLIRTYTNPGYFETAKRRIEEDQEQADQPNLFKEAEA